MRFLPCCWWVWLFGFEVLCCALFLCDWLFGWWLFAICFLSAVCGFSGLLLLVLVTVGIFDGGFSGLSWLVLLSFSLDVGCGIIWFLVCG